MNDEKDLVAWARELEFVANLNPNAVNALGKTVPIALLAHIAKRAAEKEAEAIAAWIEPMRNDIPATGKEFANAIRALKDLP